MAEKTSVDGDRVKIDDCAYQVKPAGENKYKVFDEFDMHLGFFTVRGRAIEAEDFGVEGAHPLVRIGKLWNEAHYAALSANKSAGPQAFCRIVRHEAPSEAELSQATAYVAWLRKQPGVISAHLSHDAVSKKTASITVWASREQQAALASPPEGMAPLKQVSVEAMPIVA